MPPGFLTTQSVTIAGLKIQLLQILIPVVGLALAFALHLFFQTTRHGKALLAVVQNTLAARLMGIDVERVATLSFALSGLLAGVAGIMVAPLFTISSTMGTLFGIKAFAVAILGGISSAWGVVIAGLIYGLAEALITALLGSIYTQIVTFGLVILSRADAERLFGRAEVRYEPGPSPASLPLCRPHWPLPASSRLRRQLSALRLASSASLPLSASASTLLGLGQICLPSPPSAPTWWAS
jgi:branched-chain amino acid transport system permease protein